MNYGLNQSCMYLNNSDKDKKSPRGCAYCILHETGKKVDLQRCTGCRFARYCSIDCQINNWPSRKSLVTRFSPSSVYHNSQTGQKIKLCTNVNILVTDHMGKVMQKTCLMPYANNKGADQPAHPRSLISTFVVRCSDNN